MEEEKDSKVVNVDAFLNVLRKDEAALDVLTIKKKKAIKHLDTETLNFLDQQYGRKRAIEEHIANLEESKKRNSDLKKVASGLQLSDYLPKTSDLKKQKDPYWFYYLLSSETVCQIKNNKVLSEIKGKLIIASWQILKKDGVLNVKCPRCEAEHPLVLELCFYWIPFAEIGDIEEAEENCTIASLVLLCYRTGVITLGTSFPIRSRDSLSFIIIGEDGTIIDIKEI